MNRSWLAIAALLMAGPAPAASPDPKTLAIPQAEAAKARELVRRLASEAYKEREQAQDELSRMGRLARPALLEAIGADPNPEIRARTARLLPRAEAADLQARIDTFLADAESKFEHDLPGWKLFRKEAAARDAATEKAVRDLYVEAIKTPDNLELLTALGLGSETAGRAIADRRVNVFLMQNPGVYRRFGSSGIAQPKQPGLADIAVLLLGETVIESKDIPRPGPFSYITAAQFVTVQSAMQAANNPESVPLGHAYRQFFVRWLDTRTSPEDLNNMAWMANNFRQVKETGALLRRIVKTEGVAGHARAQAMINLLQRGKEEMPTIRSQLTNENSLNNGKIQIAPGVLIDTQVRDVALALILNGEGQDLKKYGFEFQPGFNMAQVAVNYWGYGFKTDDDRNAAHRKFELFEATKKKEQSKK
jgi:hypothetical protein